MARSPRSSPARSAARTRSALNSWRARRGRGAPNRLTYLAAGLVLLTTTVGCGAATPPSVLVPATCTAADCEPLPTATPAAGTDDRNLSPASSPVSTPVSTPVAAYTSAGATVGPVVWTTAVQAATNEPVTTVSVFTVTDRTIYAAVPVHDIALGTRVRATWEYNNTSLDGFEQEIVADRDATDIWLEFNLSLVSGDVWPNGTYAIAITIDGAAAVTSEVSVLAPGG